MVFVQHFQEASHIYGAFFPAFGRTLWAIALGMMLVACATRNGGAIARFLNSKAWLPLSRVSYSTFLINPMVYLMILFSSEKALHLDIFTSVNILMFSCKHLIIIHFLQPLILIGFIMLSYISSFLFVVLFENPVAKIISNFVLKKWKELSELTKN